MAYRLTVIQGSGLVAKDRNIFGKKKSSDPYVEVWMNGRKIGTTETIKKTLDPVWHTGNHYDDIEEGKLELKIFDEDKLSAPDAMGTVTLDLGPKYYFPQPNTSWYDVPPDSAKHATGKLQLMLHSPKFTTIRGVRQLNPVYKAWKAAQ